MANGNGGAVHVDTAQLRAAADLTDSVFADANTALTATDREITGSSSAWTGTATAAFETFGTYLNGRRDALLADLAKLSDTLVANAATYDGQDIANADAIVGAGRGIG
ncbi:WXG100 family type VII secretion target [Rhodococcus sp. NPDC058521]|uniref:WXG100 family type VII secretion target n=1 Tax=Rhodococcus sp. NPDC058521 TaxID=3346536 RepID=UPI00364E9626